MDMWVVYKHTSPSGKSYIGITHKKLIYRCGKDGNGYRKNPLLWKAIQKYGWSSFTNEILESDLTKEEACKKEKYYITKYNSYTPNGYNLSLGGESGSFGYKHTEESKKRIGEVSRLRGFKGHRHTQASIEKNRLAHIGKKNPHSDEWRAKVSQSNRGKKRTEESKLKMRNAKLGTHWTEERRIQYSQNQKARGFRPSSDCIEKSMQKKRICIELLDDSNNVIKTYKSMSECAKDLNMSVANISLMSSGKYKYPKYKLRRVTKWVKTCIHLNQ